MAKCNLKMDYNCYGCPYYGTGDVEGCQLTVAFHKSTPNHTDEEYEQYMISNRIKSKKNMTQEEKARAYDKVSKEVKDFFEGKQKMYSDINQTLEYLFPELKESEDERIRKFLIEDIKDTLSSEDFKYYNPEHTKKLEEALAWLEKQGNKPQKSSIWKHWKDGIAGNGDGESIYLIKHGRTYSLSSCLGFECDYIELSELDKLLSEKQDKQKSVWSEEDEKFIKRIHSLLCAINERDFEDIHNWLKSIKQRIRG